MSEDALMEHVTVGERGIRLGQLLKLVGAADTGGTVKELLAQNLVTVNGQPESRRGAQLKVDDVVRVGSIEVRLV